HRRRCVTAHAPALVCHPFAGWRRRCAYRPGATRPCIRDHHSGVHARDRRPVTGGLCGNTPARTRMTGTGSYAPLFNQKSPMSDNEPASTSTGPGDIRSGDRTPDLTELGPTGRPVQTFGEPEPPRPDMPATVIAMCNQKG